MGMIPFDGWGRNGAAVAANTAAVSANGASDFLVNSPTDTAQGVVVAEFDPAVFEVQQLIENMSDSDNILSDGDSPYSSDSDSDNSSDSDARSRISESETESAQARSRSKGALPTTHGKKFPLPVRNRNQRPRSRSRSPVGNISRVAIDNNDLVDRSRASTSSPSTSTQAAVQHDSWRVITEGRTENSFCFVRQGSTGVSPELGLDENSSALDCLFTLLTNEFLDELLVSINSYAADLCAKNRPARKQSVFLQFEPIYKDEFFRFLAILLAMGVNPRRSVRAYWSNLPHEYTPWFSQTMPRKRFEALFHTFLHAAGANAESQEKIEPFLNKLTKAFQTAFYPEKNLSIDEMVIGFHGRWQYKQFNASKPSKYHIKIFGLCDSQTGYVSNIFTYYGSQTAYHPDLDPKCSQAIKVFEKLLRPLQKGHHIFADRFYTSMPLLRYLRSKGFHYTGTVDTRRKDFPRDIKTLKLDFLQIKWYATQDNWLLLSAFRDKKAQKTVVVATTDGEVGTREIRRRREVIHKPSCIDEYNQNMNGCNRADQQIQYYGLHKRKSCK
ncbi:hypothetical protein RRG08_011369 [Elysia crispata]|uniref:PiggyBac transposable element-derived protein domain-containing protein n=1 Tax=Elysia crispata TaxID=231223 RepID=A0AAE1DI00_9GAST|nr:hypothetical protein RRG08_011369 [Elysia crispata]